MPNGKEVDAFLKSLNRNVASTSLSSGIFGSGAHTVLLAGSENLVQALSRMSPRPLAGDPIQNGDGSFPYLPGYDGPIR